MDYYRINPIKEINRKIMMEALVSNKPPSCPDLGRTFLYFQPWQLVCFFSKLWPS